MTLKDLKIKKNTVRLINLFILIVFIIGFLLIIIKSNNIPYSKTTNEYLEYQEITDYENLLIPLQIKYFNDETCKLKCEDLLQNNLIEIPQYYNPRIYKGNIWLDIHFPDIQSDPNTEYVMDFGIIPYLLIEVFNKENNAWTIYGRTGRILKRNEMTNPSWRQFVSINKKDLEKDENGSYNLRVKLSTPSNAPINISFYQERQFTYTNTIISILSFSLLGIFITAMLFLFFYGITYSDKVYILSAVTTFVFLLFSLELKGLGPAYFWNSVPFLRSSLWLILFLGAMSILFLSISVAQFILEYRGVIKLKKLHTAINVSLKIALLLTVFLPDPVICFVLLFSVMLISLILLFIFISANNFSNKQNTGTIFFFWKLTIIITFVRLLFNLLRLYSSFSLFSIINYDFYFTYDLIAVFFLLPLFSLLFSRVKRFNRILQARNKNANRKLLKQSELIEMNNSLIKQIYDNELIIGNTLDLLKSTDSKNTFSLLQRTLNYNLNILNFNNLLNSPDSSDSANNDVIQLIPFFNNCRLGFETLSKVRHNSISLKAAIEDDYLILGNKFFYSYLFTDYVIAIMEYSSRNARILIDLSVKNNTFVFSISFEDSLPDVLENQILNNQDYRIQLLKKLLTVMKGSFEITVKENIIFFIVKINIVKIKNSDTFFSIPIQKNDSTSLEIFDYKSGSPIVIPESNLTQNGNPPLILIIEENLKLSEHISNIFNRQCSLLHATNGLEAWNILSSLQKSTLPDLIISESIVPIISGMELFYKCKQEERLSTIPFVFILPVNESEKKFDYLERGVTACITKPFNVFELYYSVYSLLHLKQMLQKETLSRISNAFYNTESIETDNVRKTDRTNRKKTSVKKNDEENANPSNRAIALTSSQTALFERAGLSSREKQIAVLISEGKTDKQIADELFISAATVATHNKKLFKKLDVHSRVELMNKVR